MGEINHKFPELEKWTHSVNEIIKDINASNFNGKEKRDAIKILEGLKLKKMAEIVNKSYKRPVDTDDIHTKNESVPNMTGVIPKEFKGDTRVVPKNKK